ncbi:hypothetical protein LNV47_19195 [Paucibacter sp. DJ4R-1]|nr:hypothetical protein [Paucibacter sp. DJ4R-1]
MSKPIGDGKRSDGRDAVGRFAAGNKGSPGRPPGRGAVAEMRDKLATDLDQIIDALKAQALAGEEPIATRQVPNQRSAPKAGKHRMIALHHFHFSS